MIAPPVFALSAPGGPGGGEGRGEVGETPASPHLTLPIPTDQVRGLKAHDATGPLPLPPLGGEGGCVAGAGA
jgi:hypothetical protein